MDNYDTHKTPTVRAWFARHSRFHVHFIPTTSSWLNQVERWVATLSQRQIKRGTHRSTVQLENAIRQCLDFHDQQSKPFAWSKSADEILDSLARFCKPISNSRY
jgi:transposase